MSRRFVLLAALAAVALIAASSVALSRASYTTTSNSAVTASADKASSWLYLYSQASLAGTDPDGANGYARRRGVNGVPGPLAASGLNEAMAVDMGDFPDKKTTMDFDRVFSIKTPATFPDASVGQITMTLIELPDPATGEDLIVNPELTVFGQTTGGAQTVYLTANRKYQLNLGIRSRKRFQLGSSYYPRIVLTLTVAGNLQLLPVRDPPRSDRRRRQLRSGARGLDPGASAPPPWSHLPFPRPSRSASLPLRCSLIPHRSREELVR